MKTIKALEDAGYVVRYNGALNIYAERSYPTKFNTFNDWLYVAWYQGNIWNYRQFKITTLPGAYWMTNLLNPKGTAILKAGQYLNTYQIGKHKGQEALIQVKPVTVYRDSTRDEYFDLNEEETGLFGINIHRAGLFSHLVNSWSAGCQVFQRVEDFNFFINLCKASIDRSKGFFDYTLFEDNES